MTRAIVASVLLVLAPVTAPDVVLADGVCRDRTPTHIRVFMIHHRGSSVPARVVRYRWDDYVGAVMASGAWPAYKPMESLKAGAAVIAARAHWYVCHPQPGYSWHGRRYDIHNGSPREALRGTDGGMLLRSGTYVHSRIRRAVAAVHGALLRRDGRMLKPQYHALGGRCGQVTTGNRLYEDGASDCARRGYRWHAILRRYLRGVRIVAPA